jgi:hypothetical protein
MSNQIVIGVAIANAPRDVDVMEVKQFISDVEGGFEMYSHAPKPPGTIQAAAFDFALILDSVESILGIAKILWEAYDRFIAPKKTKGDDSAGIYVVTRKPDATVAELMIGSIYKDKEVFIEEFTRTITRIKNLDNDDFFEEAMAEIKYSQDWVRDK